MGRLTGGAENRIFIRRFLDWPNRKTLDLAHLNVIGLAGSSENDNERFLYDCDEFQYRSFWL